MQLLLIWILTPAGKIPISLYAVNTDSNQITFIADQKTVQHALINESSANASPDSSFTSHWSHSSIRFLHFSMSATYMFLQVSYDYKNFLQSSQVIKCSCLERYVYFAFGSNNIKCYQFFFNCYHYHAALKNFKCLLAPKFQRFACHHPLYQYPRSDSRFWLLPSFLVSYITRVELGYRANLTMNIRTIHLDNFCQTAVLLDEIFN